MIKEIVGAIPRDENFYDREDLIEDMWGIAKEHDTFLIGPRRFGKSGILCKMYDEPREGFKVIFIDCEKLEDPYEFFTALLVEVLKNRNLRLKIKDYAHFIPLIPEIIESIYYERILGPTCRFYFEYYEDRLKEYGPISEKGAKMIITELSKAGSLTKNELYDIFVLATKSDESSKFDDLMNDLEMDFYIKFDANNKFLFLSKILSDWWLRWHPSSTIR